MLKSCGNRAMTCPDGDKHIGHRGFFQGEPSLAQQALSVET